MAAELLREGASVRHTLQLGHSDLSTTAAYLESIQPLELVEMARSGPPWNEVWVRRSERISAVTAGAIEDLLR